ncbi:hypothetical protein EMCRGX_G027231 [Ephydatia muelleri]
MQFNNTWRAAGLLDQGLYAWTHLTAKKCFISTLGHLAQLANFKTHSFRIGATMTAAKAGLQFSTFLGTWPLPSAPTENFPIMFGQQDSNSNVFHVLETSCLELSIMSSKRNKWETVGGSPVYKRMIWVSVALKCHSKAGAETRSVADIWNRHLVQLRMLWKLTPEVANDLRRGLNLTKFLNLPPNCMINPEQLTRLASAEDSVTPLSYLMNYLDCIVGFISTTEDIIYVVTNLRARYEQLISTNHPSLLKSLSIEGTVAGAIQEGIIFVEKLCDILRQNKLEEILCSEGLGWLRLLLKLVDVTTPGAEGHLMKLFAKAKTMNELSESHHIQLTNYVVIPELKVIQSGEPSAQVLLSTASTTLKKDLSWIQALNPQQKCYWGIVAAYCQKTSTSITFDSFDWVHSCDYVVSQLAPIYASYCNGKKIPECERILSNPLPQVIHSNDVHKFFILNGNQSMLFDIGQLLSSNSIIIDPQQCQSKKDRYLELFEKLNYHLIKYIPGISDAKYSMLSHILHRYGVVFPSTVTKHVLLPGENASPTKEQLVNDLSPCKTGLFEPPGQNLSLKATKSLTLTELAALTDQLDEFLKPLLDHMKMLVFFSLNQCKIFNNYLHLQLKQECSAISVHPSKRPSNTFSTLGALPKEDGPTVEGVTLQILAKALKTTCYFLSKLIEGTAKYSEIIAEGDMLTLASINIEVEFHILTTYFATVERRPQVSIDEGLKGICSMLELFQYTSIHIPAIHKVVQQYHLKGCLNDPSLKEVARFAEEVERSRANLTPREAVQKMQHVKNILYLMNPGAYNNLDLFPAVADSAEFFQFVRDKRFDDIEGQETFGQQYQLITAQLQHEEYNETVLNHLYAAYRFILPFMDTKQKFNSLMTKVTSLDVSGGLNQLETVNSNITLIRLWFSRTEGDTFQNVEKDLDSIIQTGHYQFEFSSTEAIVISLHYCHASSAQATLSSQPSSLEEGPPQRPQAGTKDGKKGSGIAQAALSGQPFGMETEAGKNDDKESSSKERWSKEQIDDFVRKLAFLDAEKEGGDKIKHFLHLNETANTMLKLYTQLRDLGCADCTKGAKHIILPCITEDPDSLVRVIEAKHSSWKAELSKLCDQNKWMLFFSTPKLLLLHKDLSDWISLSCLHGSKSLLDVKQKMETMSHIIGNEAELHDLKQKLSIVHTCIADVLPDYLHRVSVVCTELMDRAVRHILNEVSFLCTNDSKTLGSMKNKIETLLNQCQHKLMKCQTPMHAISMFLSALLLNHSLPTRIPMTSVAAQIVVHSCPGFTQTELIPIILSIFNGVPEPFQIFRCQSSSTQVELDLFLRRAATFPIPHLILEVNRLPFQLQECLMKFHLEIEHSQSQQTHVRLCLQYIETKHSNLRDIPWITIKEHKMTPEDIRKVQSDKPAQSLVHLVFGNAGDGKTHYIKRQLKQCPSSCTISVNEAFAPLGAIKKLQSLPSNEPKCAIFINFTLLPPGGKSFPFNNYCDSQMCPFILRYNPESEGKQTAEHTLYCRLIEVIGWFFFDLLILGYVEDRDTGLSFRLPEGLGWVIYVEVPSLDLTMTPEKMMKQFCGDIPTLGSAGITTEGPPVKFSSDPTIAEEECRKLLNEYMAKYSIKTRKITQHLFIKYMNTRCEFLDHLPAFNYNIGSGFKINNEGKQEKTDTTSLGSTLIEAMLDEVSDFCDSDVKENWSTNPHQQLIYDKTSIDLITLDDKLSPDVKAKFKNIGVKIPSMREMNTREILDKYLSKALGVELKDGRLKQIDEAKYVLTLDYTLKMLNIHERYRCCVPVIIEGETGVGKTALVQMLSDLWNHSLLDSWNTEKGRIHDLLTKRIGNLSEASRRSREHLLAMRHLPVVSLLVTREKADLLTLFEEAAKTDNVQPLDGGWWEACLCCCCCCPNLETVRIVLGGIISTSEQKVLQDGSYRTGVFDFLMRMNALLDPGNMASCGVDSGVKSASGIPGILANPQEPKETKCEGRFQHQPVVSTEWIAVQVASVVAPAFQL